MASAGPAPKRTRGRKHKLLSDDDDEAAGSSPSKKARAPAAGTRTGATASADVAAQPSPAGDASFSSAEAASVPRTPSKPRMVSQSTATPSRTTPKRVISRVPPAPSRHPVSEVYPMYLDFVRDRSILFVQLEPRSWAAQLYDFDKCERHRGVHGWTVVTAEFSLDGKASYSCSPCVDYKIHGTCVHVKVVEDVDAPDFLVMSETYGDEFIPLEGCGEEETGLPQWTFAMLSQDHQPVFVTHAGRSFSEGAWACSKHRNQCHHVAIARQRCREAEAEHGLVNLDVDDEADAQEVDELLGSEKAHGTPVQVY
ncbi:hypothetical protein AURDEDRAFT_178726 [Auricularia subglabra TFB-10046 SS5]|uniref:Uncharacterized protein n=1 Tax=Auricularia subglabra (strain TFB-10046 / SS5) TaxID=717982 RepID=J0L7E7_AURST|nr:hypothetical protein AURDEDRAFT_178726 [Auricularia subglabra TFB-10046 SS5]